MVGVGLVLLYFGLAILAAAVLLQSDRYVITRSTRAKSDAENLFALVNEPRRWPEWTPWAKLGPDASLAYEGPPTGADAGLSWSGNQAGQGRATIVESRPNELVLLRLETEKPKASIGFIDFSFKPEGGETVVVCSMSGRNSFFDKARNLAGGREKTLGPRIEQALANLSAAAEK